MDQIVVDGVDVEDDEQDDQGRERDFLEPGGDKFLQPDDEQDAARWRGPYIKDPEKLKDAWGRELIYQCPGEVNDESYDLRSRGPDGEDGTDDDIANYIVDEVTRRAH